MFFCEDPICLELNLVVVTAIISLLVRPVGYMMIWNFQAIVLIQVQYDGYALILVSF